ncbi:MAG: 4-hydroxythreonine-4-phosphate dehydrogenase PdxA [Nitrospirae bacterium]|nr:4-hydroxythreonine-4-phosphate dehydrogenase PdxA [Nitrospirota bacterium]
MKKVAITMGDPGGVGPEIIIKALLSAGIRDICIPVAIGDRVVIEETLSLLNLPLKLRIIKSPEEAGAEPGTIELIDMRMLNKFWGGKPTAEGGRACAGYIKKAAELALDKKVEAIVTAPISKEALKLAGIKWPGHTEMLAELTGTKDFAMMFVSGKLKLILATIHVPLKKVPGIISERLLLKTISLAKKGAGMLGIKNPRIAVAGLNPHAGESGILGDEEARVIAPAIRKARNKRIAVSGPYPPDVIFHKAYKGEFDIVLCMYHDQGLIPFKMLAFDTGVNMTVGLPVIRTSPDHGTAFDIAWTNRANPSSMIEAIKLAVKLNP